MGAVMAVIRVLDLHDGDVIADTFRGDTYEVVRLQATFGGVLLHGLPVDHLGRVTGPSRAWSVALCDTVVRVRDAGDCPSCGGPVGDLDVCEMVRAVR